MDLLTRHAHGLNHPSTLVAASAGLVVAGLLVSLAMQRYAPTSSVAFFTSIILTSALIGASFVLVAYALGRRWTEGVAGCAVIGMVVILVKWGFPHPGYIVNWVLWPGYWFAVDICILGLNPCPN